MHLSDSVGIVILTIVVCAALAFLVSLTNAAMWCPQCGRQLPRYRLPDSFRHAVRGGWTCRCGARIESSGRLLTRETKSATHDLIALSDT